MLRALSWLKGLSTSVGVSGHCCAAQSRAARLMANSQHVTAPVSARSPCCFVHGTFALPLSLLPLDRPTGLCN